MANVINVASTKVSRKFEGLYDFGDNLDSAVEKFGADVVFKGFVAESVIALQGIVRDALVKGKTEDEVETIIANWKPGATRARASDPIAAITSKFAKMSQEEKIAFLQKLSGMVAPAAEQTEE
jgi:hypothetical protein